MEVAQEGAAGPVVEPPQIVYKQSAMSREETPENKRGMLGYFYRERSYMI
jgi:hypothetical protein